MHNNTNTIQATTEPDTSPVTSIKDWMWETVKPQKDGIITIVYDENSIKKMEIREINYKIKQFYG